MFALRWSFFGSCLLRFVSGNVSEVVRTSQRQHVDKSRHLSDLLLSLVRSDHQIRPYPTCRLTGHRFASAYLVIDPSDDLNKFTIPILKEKLRAFGLKVSGRKAELIERLTQHMLERADSESEEIVDLTLPALDDPTPIVASEDDRPEALRPYIDARSVWSKASNILRQTPLGEKVDERSKELLVTLLRYHPNGIEKIGCGVADIKVDWSPYEDVRSNCFWLVRTDGSMEDFSIRKSIHALGTAWGEDTSELPGGANYRARPPRSDPISRFESIQRENERDVAPREMRIYYES